MKKNKIHKKAKSIKSISKVFHGFFGQKEGVSYDTLQLLKGDSLIKNCLEEASQKKKNILKTLGFGDLLFIMNQVHGSDVCVLTDQNLQPLMKHPPLADGVVTQLKGVVLSVFTADCAPLLWVDPEALVIGACHAGWKGTKTGVIESTFKKMCFLGAKPSNIRVAVGPMIQKLSYEVGQDLYEDLKKSAPSALPFFQKELNRDAPYTFDLQGWIGSKLHTLGISSIECLLHDTYASDSNFFSYRHTQKKGKGQCGRNLSAITLRKPLFKL